MLHLLLLVGSAAAIYLACEQFVTAVEHLGRRLQLGGLAVGSVLAAVGTALPESVVTGVAVLGGSDDLGVGAALGGPLALATIAYAVVGLVLLLRRAPAPPVSPRLGRDQRLFLAVFAVKVGLGLVAFAWKPWLGLLFFAGYGLYVWSELRQPSVEDDEELEPLKIGRAGLVQGLLALAVIWGASQLFVDQLAWAGPRLGLSDAVTALLLAPVATELPEVLNAVVWVRAGKVPLALANISGSMMVQATVPSGLAILFTPWSLSGPLLLSALATALALVWLLVALRGRAVGWRLLGAGAFYVAFAVVLPFV